MFLQILQFFVAFGLGASFVITIMTLTRIWLAKYTESKKVKPEYDWGKESLHIIVKAIKSLKSKKD